LWLDSVSPQAFNKPPSQNEKIANWKDINPFSVSKLEGYQTSDNFKPTYNFNSISGLPAVKFNSTCMRVDLDIHYLQRPNITVFAVLKLTVIILQKVPGVILYLEMILHNGVDFYF